MTVCIFLHCHDNGLEDCIKKIVKKNYFWLGLKIDVKIYVKRCLLCPMNKVKQAKYPCFVVIIDNT